MRFKQKGVGRAAHYVASSRRFDGVLCEPEYDPDRAVRRVRPNGAIRWRDKEIYISAALCGEPVGLVECDEGWQVLFGPLLLGTIAHGGARLRKPRRTTPTTDLNKTGNVSPMSPV
ncbi:MAG: hypothetical protein WDO17_13340 [Alphaproteobacteria bacterium]